MESTAPRTYWETSRVERKRNTFGKGVTPPPPHAGKALASSKRSAAMSKMTPKRTAHSDDADEDSRRGRQDAGQDHESLRLAPTRQHGHAQVQQQQQQHRQQQLVHGRMAPLLGPVDPAFRLQAEGGDGETCYSLGMVLPKFGRAPSPVARRSPQPNRASASLRCVTPDPFQHENRNGALPPSPVPVKVTRGRVQAQHQQQQQQQQARPWTAVRESEGLTLEQEVRVRSRTVNSICRDIERRRHAARQQLKIRDLTERVQTQAKASLAREMEMRQRLASEFPDFPIPLQKGWELAQDRRNQARSTWDAGAERAIPSHLQGVHDEITAPRFSNDEASSTEEPLYLRYLRAKKYH